MWFETVNVSLQEGKLTTPLKAVIILEVCCFVLFHFNSSRNNNNFDAVSLNSLL